MKTPPETPTNLLELEPESFGSLAETYRGELRAHCYRMLGSVHEADEMVQETFLRAWSRRDTYAGRASLRAWLYKIATNLCIDQLRKKPRRTLPIERAAASSADAPIPAAIQEPIWLEPYPAEFPGPEEANPEARYSWKESIRLAFVTALHLLSPYQRAVLIMRDVLDWPASEVAETLGQSLASVKSALYRARQTIAEHQPDLQLETMALDMADKTWSDLLEQYTQAWEAADVEAIVALLHEECTFSMPPIPSWYRGIAEVGRLMGKTIFSGQAARRWRLLPTAANAQPGFGLYRLDEASGLYDGYGIQVLTLHGNRISDITTIRNPALIEVFGLPPVLLA